MPQRIRSVYTADQLNDWLYRWRLTLEGGADLLGVGRRALQDYSKGREAIPVTVARLCWTLDRMVEINRGPVDLNGFSEPFPDRDFTKDT
ncbi:MAG: hypothetical protein J2P16_01115 [Mycobacterium sp.]|nr:hypothetical protein [Mycobacterium sp.]